MVNYPGDLPSESITQLVKMLRQRTEFNKSEFAYHVWVLQGYLQNRLLSQPNLNVMGASGPASDEEVLSILESLNNNNNEQVSQSYLPLLPLLRWALRKLISFI